jgi:hypothetical protein
MSVCTNLGLNQSSHLAAYAGYVVLYVFSRAARASTCTRDRRRPHFHVIVLMSVCVNFGPDRPIRLAAYAGHVMPF